MDPRTRLSAALRDVPDFPKPGIVFKDITPLLQDAALLRDLVGAMAVPWANRGITHVAGIESRGFILAPPIALVLGAGFIPIRKPGKLPWQHTGVDYALEYGTDRLEVHDDACPPMANVLVVDDVLATGGTAAAACSLIKKVGGMVVGCSFLLEIDALRGTGRLNGLIESLLHV
ncbi:MAG: adenine phosphoribosyltransferase [bacterium]